MGSGTQRSVGLFNGRAAASPTSSKLWKSAQVNGQIAVRSEDRAMPGKRPRTVPLVTGSNLRRAGSVKDLIQKFSGPEIGPPSPARSSASSPTECPGVRSESGTHVEESDLDSELTLPKRTLDTSTTSLSRGGREVATGQGPLPSTLVRPPVEGAQSHMEDASESEGPRISTACSSKSISENIGVLLNGSETVDGAGSVSPLVPDWSKTLLHHLPVHGHCAAMFVLHRNPPAWSVRSLSLSTIQCSLTCNHLASINPPSE